MLPKLSFILLLGIVLHSRPGVAAVDALDEVNRYRASRGLPVFARDEQLSRAADAVADYRAARLIEGHVFEGSTTDYSFLPSGARAEATGCAACTPSWGWQSCCAEERWRYAGAAWAMGRDGQRYMHLYVSNSPNAQPSPKYSWQRGESGWWYVNDNQYVGFLHENRMFQWRREDGSYSQGQYLKAGHHPK
jgi:hypothetical protein